MAFIRGAMWRRGGREEKEGAGSVESRVLSNDLRTDALQRHELDSLRRDEIKNEHTRWYAFAVIFRRRLGT